MMEGRDLYIRHVDLGTPTFPKTLPLRSVEDAENRLSINSQSFLPAPSWWDGASLPPSRPILTQQFEDKLGHSIYCKRN